MTNRYTPNEATCPIPLELLSLLMRSNEQQLADAVDKLPMAERAALAAFCYGRLHLRDLGFAVALRCSEQALFSAAGLVGEALFEQSRMMRESFDLDPAQRGRKKVSLSRLVA